VKSSIKLGTIAGIGVGLRYSWFIIAALIAFSLAEEFRQTAFGSLSSAGFCWRQPTAM
jgi:hypothetical protein